ncbi:MAG: DUF4349 domain-containing protein [Clostridiales bacterium]|nr:DUF4349 domain-containing protein [Clostridiales bacterium]
MKKKTHGTLALFLAVLLLAGGCGAVDKSAETVNQMMDFAGTADGGWTEEMKTESAVETASAAEEEVGDTASSGEENDALDLSKTDQAARKLIKTVSLSMETKEFDTLKTKLEESVTSFGGYIENSSFDAPQGEYNYRYYSLTVRIPSEKLDEFVAETGKMGILTNKTESVEDVTLDYVDKTAYKESLQVEYDRVTELLEKAEDLEQVLALESKLSQLRYEINSYESQLRTYDNLIDYSTVHIYISEVEYEKEVSDTIGSRISNGFRSSLYQVRDFFVNLFVGLVSNIPVLLLLAAAAVMIALIVKKAIRRRGEKKSRTIHTETREMDSENKENQ